MLRTYLAAGVLFAVEAVMAAFAMSPDVDPVYRSVYIDRQTACYPVEVTGEYRLGTRLSFGFEQGALRRTVVRCGLRDPDRAWDGSWSDGERTLLEFAVEPPLTGLRLDAVIWPFLDGGIASQRVVVSANAVRIAELVLDSNSAPYQTILVPGPIARANEGRVEISFEYPDARSPRELGIGNDDYAYAVFIRSVRLSAYFPPPK